MSIAVTAVVQPSRLLFGLLMLMCASLLAIGVVIFFGGVGELSMGIRSLLAMLYAGSGVYVFVRALKNRKIHKIYISGIGQIRLVDHPEDEGVKQGGLVALLPDSTLWPGLLLLRLQNEKRQTLNLVVLPDSVSKETFRALLVACRWLAMRHAHADKPGASRI